MIKPTTYNNSLVPPVDICSRLESVGWETRPVFGWINYKGTTSKGEEYNDWELQDYGSRYCIIAPTLQEIMEELPRMISIDDGYWEDPSITRSCDGYYTAGYEHSRGKKYFTTGGIFPAVEAAAELWLKVQTLIK